MTLKQMIVFSAVCTEGTLARAAEKLYISQSAVSRTIKEITEETHLELFQLVGRKLEPTDVARQLRQDVDKVLLQYNALQRKLATGGYVPCLRVGCSLAVEAAVLPKVVPVFEQTYPGTRLYITSNHTAEIEKSLLAGDFDFAIVTRSVSNINLVQEDFAEENFYWVCAPTHPIAAEKNVDFARLARETLYLPGEDVLNHDLLELYALEQGIELRPKYTTISVIATLNAVLAGTCVALMSQSFIDEYAARGEIKIVADRIRSTRRIGAVYLRDRALGEEARAFITLCAGVCCQRFQPLK